MTGDTRKPKKSETLEVRLPWETKQAFLGACREDGTTASEVVRVSIDDYLEKRERPVNANPARTLITMIPRPVRKRRYLAAAGGLAGLAVFAALPSAAGPDLMATFRTLDANGDGVITAEEFVADKPPYGGKLLSAIITVVRTGPDRQVSPHGYTFWFPSVESTGEIRQMRIVHVMKPDGPGSGAGKKIDVRSHEFTEFDANGDGVVSLAEFEAQQAVLLSRGFEALDTDGDGFLSELEYLGVVAPWAVSYNSSLPKTDDLTAQMIDMSEAVEAGFKSNSSPSRDDLASAFTRLDRNGDGLLTLQEYLPSL